MDRWYYVLVAFAIMLVFDIAYQSLRVTPNSEKKEKGVFAKRSNLVSSASVLPPLSDSKKKEKGVPVKQLALVGGLGILPPPILTQIPNYSFHHKRGKHKKIFYGKVRNFSMKPCIKRKILRIPQRFSIGEPFFVIK